MDFPLLADSTGDAAADKVRRCTAPIIDLRRVLPEGWVAGPRHPLDEFLSGDHVFPMGIHLLPCVVELDGGGVVPKEVAVDFPELFLFYAIVTINVEHCEDQVRVLPLVAQHPHELFELVEIEHAIVIGTGLPQAKSYDVPGVLLRTAVCCNRSANGVWGDNRAERILEFVADELIAGHRPTVIPVHATPQLPRPLAVLLRR
mmetsp:Transcript_108540/g.305950  ORF Transcript_108540/g.305950 Transcript_108540/m.305950 type:complete len:202 (-) Transcript_108540:84-689(-)